MLELLLTWTSFGSWSTRKPSSYLALIDFILQKPTPKCILPKVFSGEIERFMTYVYLQIMTCQWQYNVNRCLVEKVVSACSKPATPIGRKHTWTTLSSLRASLLEFREVCVMMGFEVCVHASYICTYDWCCGCIMQRMNKIRQDARQILVIASKIRTTSIKLFWRANQSWRTAR